MYRQTTGINLLLHWSKRCVCNYTEDKAAFCSISQQVLQIWTTTRKNKDDFEIQYRSRRSFHIEEPAPTKIDLRYNFSAQAADI